MEAPALCDTIFQFIGQGGPVQTAYADVSVSSAATTEIDEEGPTSTDEEVQPTSKPLQKGCSQSDGTHQHAKEGLMLAFVGNKLNEYNLRGVEAGIGMVAVDKTRVGKALNTKLRRQGRVKQSPYERRSSGFKKR